MTTGESKFGVGGVTENEHRTLGRTWMIEIVSKESDGRGTIATLFFETEAAATEAKQYLGLVFNGVREFEVHTVST
jgi:hypothetical protein